MKTNKLFLLALLVSMFASCVQDKADVELRYYSQEDYKVIESVLDLPEIPHNYTPNTPAHFGNSRFFSGAGPVTDGKATLGRVLFYDKKLSANEAVSCASCHDQSKAFADPVAFSEGFEGRATLRNSFALGAVASFSSTYDDPGGSDGALFWDNRATTVSEQSALTLQDDIEMGMDLDVLVDRLNQEEHYRILFNKAYYSEEIDQHMVLDALSNFVNAMVTSNTKFDKGMGQHFRAEAAFSNFTPGENRGKDLYMANCSSCHGANQVKTLQSVANNGLDREYEDNGIGELTGATRDMGVFKVPLLRNVALTGPYMHDGRFETLEDVIDFYTSGIQDHRNLDPKLQGKIEFSTQEKEDLVSFLNTLTDEVFIADVRFSDPFK